MRPIIIKEAEDNETVIRDVKQKRASRNSAISLIHSTNIFPFKFNGSFMCFYCPNRFVNMPELAQHVQTEHKDVTEDDIRKAFGKDGFDHPIKVNVLNYSCKLCNDVFFNFKDLKLHLIGKHQKGIDLANDGVLPYKITMNEFVCVLCGKKLEQYWILNKHINEHYTKFKCSQCGAAFATLLRLRGHAVSHEGGHYPCDRCSKVFRNVGSKQQHIQRVHLKAPRYKCHHCGETFKEHNQKKKHLLTEHGIQLSKGDAKAKGVKQLYLRDLKHNKKDSRRDSAIALIISTNVCPFKFHGMFLCLYCPSRFANMPELVQHVRLEHKNVTENDIKKASAKDSFNHPIKVNVLDYGCKFCDDEILNFEDLKRHLINKHKIQIDLDNDGVWPYMITDNEFICVLCGIKLEEYHLLTKHLNEHYRKFICDQCGVGFASELRLRGHAVSHEMGSYPCDECGKVFSNSSLKQQHLDNVHMKKKNVKCTQCAETFRDYYRRQKHLLSAHGVKLKEYKCSFCPKVFYRNSNVRNHERRNHMLTTKKYTCDICNYKAFSKHRIAGHMICHTGEKNFECVVCKKKYGTKKSLSEHMKIHNNDRQFVCQFCDRAFIQKVSLKGHIKTHHKDFLVE